MPAGKSITCDHPVEPPLSSQTSVSISDGPPRAIRKRMDRQRIPGNVRLPDHIISIAAGLLNILVEGFPAA